MACFLGFSAIVAVCIRPLFRENRPVDGIRLLWKPPAETASRGISYCPIIIPHVLSGNKSSIRPEKVKIVTICGPLADGVRKWSETSILAHNARNRNSGICGEGIDGTHSLYTFLRSHGKMQSFGRGQGRYALWPWRRTNEYQKSR